MKTTFKESGLLLVFALLIFGCEGEKGSEGPIGLSSLMNIIDEPPGNNCANGGLKVEIGIDNNQNKILDPGEVLTADYICDGKDGKSSLTKVVTEPAGSNCETGGIRINTGIDANENGVLDDAEINSSTYVCNGNVGDSYLNRVTSEDAGSNCANGGLKIESGMDLDCNGVLDNDEVTSTAFVCNGNDGKNSLTNMSNELPGGNCENGGYKIQNGIDQNNNGTLDESEIISEEYVCNGLDGDSSLLDITTITDNSNCENGGVQINSGIDIDGNGILDEGEVLITKYICNGIDGGYDEQIRFRVAGGIGSAASTSSTTPVTVAGLIKFDIRNYEGVDSVIFVSNPYVYNSINTAFLELYNFTDNSVISNSIISTNSEYANSTYLNSGNLYEYLPHKEVTLGISIKSEIHGETCSSGIPYLFLYRRKQ